MVSRFSAASLVPPGLVVDNVTQGEDMIVVTACGGGSTAACAACGIPSRRMQSRYGTIVCDLERRRVAPLAAGVAQDITAIRIAITEPWSKGQITRLKMVKRQMYGRAKLGLLDARLLGAT